MQEAHVHTACYLVTEQCNVKLLRGTHCKRNATMDTIVPTFSTLHGSGKWYIRAEKSHITHC